MGADHDPISLLVYGCGIGPSIYGSERTYPARIFGASISKQDGPRSWWRHYTHCHRRLYTSADSRWRIGGQCSIRPGTAHRHGHIYKHLTPIYFGRRYARSSLHRFSSDADHDRRHTSVCSIGPNTL